VEEPNGSDSKKNSLFRGTPIEVEMNEPELSASFYTERNPLEQATPTPYQSFGFPEYQSLVTFDVTPIPIPTKPVMAIMQTQAAIKKPREYGMNKPTPFTSNQTKIRWFLQDCLGYLDMNQVIYNADRLRIGFILSYMNNGEAANWKEYYLNTLEDPVTGMPNFPTLVTFLADVQLAFRAADQVRDAVNKLETLKQGCYEQSTIINTCLLFLFFFTCSYTFSIVFIFIEHAENTSRQTHVQHVFASQ
jgi:hypothetical protein